MKIFYVFIHIYVSICIIKLKRTFEYCEVGFSATYAREVTV